MFSNQPAKQSQGTSNSVIHMMLEVGQKITNINLSEEQATKITENMSFMIRKTAHFTVYLILGILVTLLGTRYSLTIKDLLIISILICIFYACSDEFHQLFVNGRSGELRDVLIDSSGSSLGILLTTWRYKKLR